MSEPCIQVVDVTKRYRLGMGFPTLRSLLANKRLRKGHHGEFEKYHWALKGVSFELESGQALGIIGPNGAGKTTILKILSHVTQPTSGYVLMRGRFSALIELGAGFHPDLTGRENIFLNGAILGMSQAEIQERFDQIVDFAGIGAYLDTPVKRYSSGMYARLGFAIAAHVDPQILLVDEVLAVGDYAFQMKCYARMEQLRANGTSLIFISHNMDAVRQVCDRGLVMYRGQALFQGTAAEAIVAYSDAIRQAARQAPMSVPLEGGLAQNVMTFDAEITCVRLLDADKDVPVQVLESGKSARVVVDVHCSKNVHAPIFSLTINTPDGRVVYDTMTSWMRVQMPDFSAGETWRIEFKLNLPLLEGAYEVDITIVSADLSHFYDYARRALGFSILGSAAAKGLVNLDAQVLVSRS